MPSVLFVCTANQFRSPITAACLLKTLEGERTDSQWTVESAGTWGQAGLPAPDVAVQVAKLLDVDGLERHITRQVDQALLDRFDLVLVMESGHREAILSEFSGVRRKVHLLSEVVDDMPYDIPDPAYRGISPHGVGRQLQALISRGREKILHLAERLGKGQEPGG